MIDRALLLTCGHGLRPLSIGTPAALVEFVNTPIIVHNINWLIENGFTTCTILVYRDEQSAISRIVDGAFHDAALKINYADYSPLKRCDFNDTAVPFKLGDDTYAVFDCNQVIINGRSLPLKNIDDYRRSTNAAIQIIYNDNNTMIHETTIAPHDGHCVINSNVADNCIIGSHVMIGQDCTIGSNVVIGDHAKIGSGVYLQDCVIMSGTIVTDHAYVTSSVIGRGSRVGSWVHVIDSVLGDDIAINRGIVVKSTVVLPHKSIASHSWGRDDSQTIIM